MLTPEAPPYDVATWRTLPFADRLRLSCQAWAAQGYGTPLAVHAAYGLKIAAYVGMWLLACTWGPERDLADIGTWWASRDAFAKAIVWTMLFEGLGLGCGSGPLTARYVPPVGGALYFLRPGTVRLPPWPAIPLTGGDRRTVVDVALYALGLACLVRAVVTPSLAATHIVPILVLVPLMGLRDKTLFLVHRSEHYLSALIMLLAADHWVPGNQAVWLAIWLWAAISKLTPHFPAVMCVMTSNAPWTRWGPLRRWIYRDAPDDLRPSRFAYWLAHTGTVAEFVFPIALALSPDGPLTLACLLLTTSFHLFILSCVPMAVPLEWNVVMIYGAWVLFGVHADASVLALLDAPVLAAWVLGFHVLLPLYGSQVPAHVSFLLSMRYYAGNWAWSVWLFRPDAAETLDARMTTWSALPPRQLARFYDDDTVATVLGKVAAFRAMHLHGRALQTLLPLAVDAAELDTRLWLDGEMVAGMIVGWNFGDGHLHGPQLLAAVQRRCGFADGDLRCIFVESMPIVGHTLAYTVADAATGVLATGEVDVRALVDRHPWPSD